MRNGATFSHPAAISSVLGVFTAMAMLASFATAIYGVSLPHMRMHYAHSLPVLVVFEVFQSIFFTGALSLNWPSVCAAFWSNFAWSAGQIPVKSMLSTVDSFVGVTGNASQVGGAGSSVINNNGGLLQQLYGRSLGAVSDEDSSSWTRGYEMLVKRGIDSNNETRQYDWNGGPVGLGLPIPGNWSDFAGELSELGIPSADAFLLGILWFLILLGGLLVLLVLFKFSLDVMDSMKMIKNDGLSFFRSHWLGFAGAIVGRTVFIGFFAIMMLALYQLSLGGKGGPMAVAVVFFILFLFTAFGLAFYACYSRLRFGRYHSSPDRLHFRRKKLMKFIPWYSTVRESQLHEKDKSKTFAGSLSIFRIDHVNNNEEMQDVHQDQGFIKRFGWLTAHYRKSRWWFFAMWVVYQVIRACFIGGARASPNAQVFGLLVVELLALIMIWTIRPFEGTRNTALAVYMLSISKVLTAALCVAFLPQYNVPRIPTTVIGVVIIVIQGLLVIATMILIVLSVISSYMSIARNRESISPRFLQSVRIKYYEHIEQKAADRPPEPEPEAPEPQVPKEPYFSVNTVRRAPKIEDEDEDVDVESIPAVPDPQSSIQSRTRALSNRSSYSNIGTVPFGARVYRASWTSRDFSQMEFERVESSPSTPTKQLGKTRMRSVSSPAAGPSQPRHYHPSSDRNTLEEAQPEAEASNSAPGSVSGIDPAA